MILYGYMALAIMFYAYLNINAETDEEQIMAATLGAPLAASWPLTMLAFWYLGKNAGWDDDADD